MLNQFTEKKLRGQQSGPAGGRITRHLEDFPATVGRNFPAFEHPNGGIGTKLIEVWPLVGPVGMKAGRIGSKPGRVRRKPAIIGRNPGHIRDSNVPVVRPNVSIVRPNVSIVRPNVAG